MRVTLDDVRMKTARASGPGGENRDHRSTKVQLWITVADLPLDEHEKNLIRQKLDRHVNNDDELWVECEETRSQELNRDRALEHLNALIEGALQTMPPRIPSRPPRSAKETRIREKKATSEKKGRRRVGHMPRGNP